MAVDGLEEKELGGSCHDSSAPLERQQLMKTPDAAIGTTKRGTVPSEFHAHVDLFCCFRPFTGTPIYEQQGWQFY